MKKTRHAFVVSAFVVVIMTPAVAAADGWDFLVGAGVASIPVYDGAGDRMIAPIPRVEVTYSRGPLEVIGSLSDGLELSYFSPGSSTVGSVAVREGVTRNPNGYETFFGRRDFEADNRALLAVSGSRRGTVELDATLGVVTSIGVFGTTVGFRPTESDERDYDGMIYSVLYGRNMPVSWRLNLETAVVLQAMNGNYADAWYSVPESVSPGEEFFADGGLQLTRLVVKGSSLITPHIGLSLQLMEAILLGDARRSPLVEDPAQLAMIAGAFYRF